MSDAMSVTAAGRGVCLSPGYAMAVGPFDPFATAAAGEAWEEGETWSHTVPGRREALLSLRFAVFSRLSEELVGASDALSESALRQGHVAPGCGLLRVRVSVTRKEAHASKTFLVGSGGIDVFGSGVRASLLAPPSMGAPSRAAYPLAADGFGALEEVWTPLLGEDGASFRPKTVVHTYCAAAVPAPVPPSAVRYEVIGADTPVVLLSAGGGSNAALPRGPVCGFRSIEVDRDAVVAWEVEP